MSQGPFIRLHSGGKFHILKPKLSELNIEDICWGLSHICRFTGHSDKFYSVAQHVCLVSDLLPDNLKLEGLLHDATESVYSDINSPLKSVLPQYKELELRAEALVAKKFKLKFPYPSDVKLADMRLLVTEFRDLMTGSDYKDLPFQPLDKKIKPWSIQKSREEFIARYREWQRP